MMVDFLLSIIPTCLFIWCWHILFQPDHIFENAGDWITERLGEYWSKPIINCAVCMSSIYGFIGFFALRYFFDIQLPLKQLIPYVMCLCGLNTLLSKLTTKERIIVDE